MILDDIPSKHIVVLQMDVNNAQLLELERGYAAIFSIDSQPQKVRVTPVARFPCEPQLETQIFDIANF
jgi:hypothetical protein